MEKSRILLTSPIDSGYFKDSEKLADLLKRNRRQETGIVSWPIVLMAHNMNFNSLSSAQHGLTPSVPTDLNSIGCEAWIDVGRFSSREHSAQPIVGYVKASEDQSHSAGSLTKSFAVLRKKLLQGSAGGID
jgi:hypothetical protein